MIWDDKGRDILPVLGKKTQKVKQFWWYLVCNPVCSFLLLEVGASSLLNIFLLWKLVSKFFKLQIKIKPGRHGYYKGWKMVLSNPKRVWVSAEAISKSSHSTVKHTMFYNSSNAGTGIWMIFLKNAFKCILILMCKLILWKNVLSFWETINNKFYCNLESSVKFASGVGHMLNCGAGCCSVLVWHSTNEADCMYERGVMLREDAVSLKKAASLF